MRYIKYRGGILVKEKLFKIVFYLWGMMSFLISFSGGVEE